MNAGIVQELIGVETAGRNSRSLLPKKDIVEILRKKVLLVCNEDVMSLHCHNGRGAACYPVNLKVSENVKSATM